MTPAIELTEHKQTSAFYPTPNELIKRMLQKVQWNTVKTILEPSAGKGDILKEIARQETSAYNVDAIEIDENLRAVLNSQFSQKRKDSLEQKVQSIKNAYGYVRKNKDGKYIWFNKNKEHFVSETDGRHLADLDKEIRCFFQNGLHIVHDDFLSYTSYKTYHLIIMNPPFHEGDRHLLKALSMQKRGGQIVCLLNAETIRNPYTQTRKSLVSQLQDIKADIEYIKAPFVRAERTTDVDVALIYVNIPYSEQDGEPSIYERLEQARTEKEPILSPNTELTLQDYIKAAIQRYQIEIESGIELIRTYCRMKPYLCDSFDIADYPKAIIEMTDNNGKEITVNNYIHSVRLKYWQALLTNKKFIGRLTSTLQNEYKRKIADLADYEFSEFNIATLSAEINANIRSGIENEIERMYDRLTEEHSYYPECTKNKHLYNGWKTNKAWKLEKKSILPVYGIYDGWEGKPRVYKAYDTLSDIERILNFFDGNMTADVDMQNILQSYFEHNVTRKIPCKFFTVTFYKKGTVHIEYTCPDLIARYNIYMAQQRKWLPPCYGRKAYNDMTKEEQAVIDSFQGKQAYDSVMHKPEYFLASPTQNKEMCLLGMQGTTT